jgi:hypothetical protein
VFRLYAYAITMSVGESHLHEHEKPEFWHRLAASGTENLSGKNEGLGPKLVRVLALAQGILDSCHGDQRPVLLPHHASANGHRVELSVQLQCIAEPLPCMSHCSVLVDQKRRVATVAAHSQMVCIRSHCWHCWRH